MDSLFATAFVSPQKPVLYAAEFTEAEEKVYIKDASIICDHMSVYSVTVMAKWCK